MPNAETVNPQISEGVAVAERVAVGSAPAVAVGSALQAMSHAASLQMLNATQAYQNWSTSMQAVATQSAAEILDPGKASPPSSAAPSAVRSKRPASRVAKKGKA